MMFDAWFMIQETPAVTLFLATLGIGLYGTLSARRKGYGGYTLLWAWLPLVNFCGLFLILSLPDRAVQARARALAARLAPPRPMPEPQGVTAQPDAL